MSAEEDSAAAAAAASYRAGQALRAIAAEHGVSTWKIGEWLDSAGVVRRPKSASRLDVAEVERLRQARASWADIGRELGVAPSTAQRAHTGGRPTKKRLQPAQARRLRELWSRVPAAPRGGRAVEGSAEGAVLLAALRRHREAGVVVAELATVLAVSAQRVSRMMGGERAT